VEAIRVPLNATSVVDFHSHVGGRQFWTPQVLEQFKRMNPDFLDSLEELMVPDRLLAFFKSHGIDYAVCIADHSEVTGVVPNEFLLSFCRGHRELIPFCSVDPHDPRITRMMMSYPELDRIVGFKFFPTYNYFYPNDRKLYPFYDFLQSAGKVVMFHTGTSSFPGSKSLYGNPLYIEEVAVDFPRLTIVMAHSGRPFWYQEAFYLSRLHDNLYMDLAGVPPQHLLEYFPKIEANIDRVLFGTDFPTQPKPLRTLVETVRGLPLRPESISKILGGNAMRLLRL
jgi:predicted TIM-barrel fold metal-dependent hydrolase